jgi:hypothetical protein
MMSMNPQLCFWRASSLAAVVGLALSGLALAQGAPSVTVSPDTQSVSGDDAPEWMRKLAIDPASPKAKAYADQAKARKLADKELRRIRMKYFGHMKSQAVRQEGLAKLSAYDKPELYPALIEIFKSEASDVKLWILDMFRDSKSDAGDIAMAWVAVQDDSREIRLAAAERVKARLNKDLATPDQVKYVIYEGLRGHKDSAMAASAELASNLNLVDVIPWLINAQVGTRPQQQVVSAGGVPSGEGALAWIMVGQQTAFVSDLVPVVGPNAVAFDPQLSVINTGVLLRILDAVVIEYHVDINNTLIDWTTREYDSDTRGLGFNVPAWRKWYDEEFVPHLAEKARIEQAKALAEKAAAGGTTSAAVPHK